MAFKGAGILIYKKVNNEIFLLLGKENLVLNHSGDLSGDLFSDFGGGKENDEQYPIDTACREYYEETMGAFHSVQEIKALIDKDHVYYNIKYKYYQYFIEMNVDDITIKTYNKIRTYLNSCLKYVEGDDGNKYQKLTCCPNGYIEKQEIRWFSINDILDKNELFRKPFFNSLLNILNERRLI